MYPFGKTSEKQTYLIRNVFLTKTLEVYWKYIGSTLEVFRSIFDHECFFLIKEDIGSRSEASVSELKLPWRVPGVYHITRCMYAEQ